MSENVGYATLQIIPSAKGFAKSLEGEIGPQMGPVGTTTGRTAGKGFSAGLLGVATKALPILGGAMAAFASVDFLKDAIGQASDLNETVSKTAAIFGNDAMPALTKFADEAAKKMGQTKAAALDGLSTFGIFGKGAGLSGKGLSKFATDLSGLSSDLASFYNTDPTEAIDAIGAALRGENEPIRRFGVLLDDATLRQEALKLGLVKTTKEALTPQQKALAAQAAIMEQTKVAQGDFARTSGGLANQQRILSAQFDNVKSTLGQYLLPAVLAVTSGLNSFLGPALSWIQGFIQTTVVPGVQSLASSFMKNVWPAIQTVAGIIAENLSPAIQALAAYWSDTLWPAVQRMIPVFGTIAKIIGVVVGAVLLLVSWLLGKLIPVVLTVLGVLTTFATTLMSKVAGAIEWVITHFGDIVTFVKDFPGKILKALGDLGKTLWSAGSDLVRGFIEGIKSKASDLVNTIRSAITDRLPDFVKNALGIRSPSRVFAELGKWTMRGFTEGIDGEAARTQRAMASAIAPPSLDGSSAGGGTPLSASLGRQVARLYLDGRQVAEAVFEHGGREYAYGRA